MAKKVLEYVVVTYFVSGKPQDPPAVHTYGPYTQAQARRVSRKLRDEFEELISYGEVKEGATLDTYPRKIITIPDDYRKGTSLTPAYSL